MKILLLGEYSNVHATLAAGLRQLGHEVTVASNGDFWKSYPRDIDLARQYEKMGGLKLIGKLWSNRNLLQGYDVVQLINPMFVELRAERILPLYRWLRRHNGEVLLGAFGMDYFWVSENMNRKPLRYSDFNIGNKLRHTTDAKREEQDWLGTAKERLNRIIAEDCDGIIAGLYEYWAIYNPIFPDKTSFIPYPIIPKSGATVRPRNAGDPLHIFIGISRGRNEYKGTDIMLAAAKAIEERHPDLAKLTIAEGVPFSEYVEMMNSSDCILDQLYSYTPSMNALEAMSRGIICVGGGEPENYEILGEKTLRSIVNVQPNYENVYQTLEELALHRELLSDLQAQSIEYIHRHHDYIKVAQQYLDFYLTHGKGV